VPIPETAADALAAWKAKQPLDAVKMGPPGANQAEEWARVFEIIEAAPAGDRFTLQQFEAWCWNSRVGFALADPKATPPFDQFSQRQEARAVAFSILREGYANVIRRRRQLYPLSATMVQKP
jgi:hypothetical protein